MSTSRKQGTSGLEQVSVIYKETICWLHMSYLPTWLDMKYCTDISVKKAWKPPSSLPILIYKWKFRNKPSLDHYCHLHKPLLAQQINRDKILFSHTQRRYQFLFLNYFLLFYVIINFYKNYFIFKFFFWWKLFLFFHVPGCSGMSRNVPCSGFYRRPGNFPL